jgi:hypothetical protein
VNELRGTQRREGKLNYFVRQERNIVVVARSTHRSGRGLDNGICATDAIIGVLDAAPAALRIHNPTTGLRISRGYRTSREAGVESSLVG